MSNYPGFDCYAYPGENAMKIWKAQSPYVFCGYYLVSANHPSDSWIGSRGTLQGQGWGLAVLYVALPATSANLNRQRGATDAADAISQCRDDSFPSGTIAYLDVEPVDTVPQALYDYYRGFIRALLDSSSAAFSLAPGVYCHAKNADTLYNAAQQEYADAGLSAGAPAFWITKSDSGFLPAVNAPTDCGVAYANIWQGRIDIQGEEWGGVSLDVDWDVADSSDPSAAALMLEKSKRVMAMASQVDQQDNDPAAPQQQESPANRARATYLANYGSSWVEEPTVDKLPLTATLSLDWSKVQAFLHACQAAGVKYGLGAKVPNDTAVPGRDFTKVDCSGFVRAAIRRATDPVVPFPDGSVVQQEWVQAKGFVAVSVADGLLTDGKVRIAFLNPKDSPEGIGHVVLVCNAVTAESHGGVGPDARPFNGQGWQARARVYLLTI